MTQVNLKSMPYAQAKVLVDKNTIALKSYNTIVAEIENGWLKVYGLFSMTTRRHLSAFCKEYANIHMFNTIKVLASTGDKYNIYTGEVLPL